MSLLVCQLYLTTLHKKYHHLKHKWKPLFPLLPASIKCQALLWQEQKENNTMPLCESQFGPYLR